MANHLPPKKNHKRLKKSSCFSGDCLILLIFSYNKVFQLSVKEKKLSWRQQSFCEVRGPVAFTVKEDKALVITSFACTYVLLLTENTSECFSVFFSQMPAVQVRHEAQARTLYLSAGALFTRLRRTWNSFTQLLVSLRRTLSSPRKAAQPCPSSRRM